mmetsp:Transcript_49850/g.124987  ORF Transcript_49850/g.124987 Transcript_49850/m.124987 type:complete len:89 (-) Transcript_49850:87-353(-)
MLQNGRMQSGEHLDVTALLEMDHPTNAVTCLDSQNMQTENVSRQVARTRDACGQKRGQTSLSGVMYMYVALLSFSLKPCSTKDMKACE